MSVVLVIDSPDGVTKKVLGSKALTLGRSSSCDMKLSDSMVSGKHLSISIGRDGKTLVKDLETTNGTFINGSKIMEAHLFLDDEITIGEIVIFLGA